MLRTFSRSAFRRRVAFSLWTLGALGVEVTQGGVFSFSKCALHEAHLVRWSVGLSTFNPFFTQEGGGK